MRRRFAAGMAVACLLGSGGMAIGVGSPEIVAYGDFASRNNNLTSPQFRSGEGGSTEMRLLFGHRSEKPNLRPYIKTNVAASSKSIAEENTVSSGVGCEISPLAGNSYLLDHPKIKWLTATRVFTEYMHQSASKGERLAWNPDHNWIIGADLWKEFGATDPLHPKDGGNAWTELYLGAAYHTTNFYLPDYDSVCFGLNVRTGRKYDTQYIPLMPYAVVDANITTKHPYFWQNRVISGIGLRTERRTGPQTKVKLYIEQLRVVDYPKDSPEDTLGIPENDTRIGLCYQWNRY